MGNRDPVHFSGHRRTSFHAFPVPMDGSGAGCLSAPSVTITFPCNGFPVNGKRVFAVCRLVFRAARYTRLLVQAHRCRYTYTRSLCTFRGSGDRFFLFCPYHRLSLGTVPFGAIRCRKAAAPRSALSTAADFDAAEGDRSAECISG